MATPTEFKKLTDASIPEFGGTLVDADVIHVVDKSNTSQDPDGSSFRTQLSYLWTYIQTKVNALGFLTSVTKTGTGLTGAGTSGSPLALDFDTAPTSGSTKVVTSGGIFTYVNSLVSGLLDLRGGYDASGDAFPTTGGSGTAGAIVKGDAWYITVAGTLGTTDVNPGDLIFANVDTPGSTAGNWTIIDHSAIPVDPDTMLLENITVTALLALITGSTVNTKTCYRITDAADGVIRVWGLDASNLICLGFKEGQNNGFTYNPGEFGNYDIGVDLFFPISQPTSGTWTPVVSNVAGAATITVEPGAYYTRVGDIVTETFQINAEMDALQTEETFNVSTAILRSTNFPDGNGIRGTWSLFETGISYINNISVKSAESTKLIEVTMATNAEAKATIQLNHQYSLV